VSAQPYLQRPPWPPCRVAVELHSHDLHLRPQGGVCASDDTPFLGYIHTPGDWAGLVLYVLVVGKLYYAMRDDYPNSLLKVKCRGTSLPSHSKSISYDEILQINTTLVLKQKVSRDSK